MRRRSSSRRLVRLHAPLHVKRLLPPLLREAGRQTGRPEDERRFREDPDLDITFKQHPSGVNFAHWVANLYTGELPEVAVGPQPTFDDVVDAFNAAGLFVAYSTGTTGQHTVIPRDKRTFYTYQYATAKMAATIYDSLGIDHNLALFPKPSQANLWVSQAQSFTERSYNDYRYALDIKITVVKLHGQCPARRSRKTRNRLLQR